jgi:antitoxin component YwqK of YwqJK toxin-antitoxin module
MQGKYATYYENGQMHYRTLVDKGSPNNDFNEFWDENGQAKTQ